MASPSDTGKDQDDSISGMKSPTPSEGLSKTVCFLCRQRKVKCDRRKPSCGFCVKNGLGAECRYVVTQKKHGLRAGYVSKLEHRLDKLEAEVREMKAQQSQCHRQFPLGTPESTCNDLLPPSSPSVSLPIPPSPSTALPISVLSSLCNLWFQKYHRWFPILHNLSLLNVLEENSQNLELSPLYVVIKAIAAVTLPNTPTQDTFDQYQREQISNAYRQEITMHAMDQLSLPSLQAVLIITIIELGAGKMSKFWNLVALCKRMAMQLGLRDLVVNQCSNFNNASLLPPRMLPLPNTLVEQEEKIRAYWMTEVLDASSTMGVGWNLGLTIPDQQSWLPCSDNVWTSAQSFVSVATFGDFDLSSSFSLYVTLVGNELYVVHQFLQQPFDQTTSDGRAKWQSECRAVDERLQKWRESSPLLASFAGCYDVATDEMQIVFDPIIVMSFAVFDSAIIALYQRLAFPPSGLDKQHGPFYYAIQRCLDACDEMTSVVRSVKDVDLENMGPHIIFPIFVASRFFLVHAKTLGVETPRNLDLLIYSLRLCGQHWQLARRLHKVLRTAAAESEVKGKTTTLPPQFFDLQYSHLDIDKVLEIWAEGQDPAG